MEPAEPLRLECQHFLDCMASGTAPRTDGAEGLRVLRVLDASERSRRERRVVELRENAPVAVLPAKDRTDVQIHATSHVHEAAEIGPGTRIWHFCHVMQGARIGANCVLGQNVMVGPGVVIGERCKVQNNVSLYQGVVLEDGVFCGPSSVFTNVMTPRAEIERKREFLETRVGRGATIGANATIVCGVRLGAYCLIGAGAVVTRDVPPFALVAGNPARRIGWVGEAGEPLGDDLVCPRTGQRYVELGPDRLEPVAEDAAPASAAAGR